MRLFISREGVEQGPIRDSLSDRSAVVSFGMIYGVYLDTTSEAQALIAGARARSITLHLIGHAGSAFDRSTLRMKPRKTPRAWVDVLVVVGMLGAYAGAALFAASMFTNSVLIRIKATDTLAWISTEDNTASGMFGNSEHALSAAQCPPASGSEARTPASDRRAHDSSVLCSIWRSPEGLAEVKSSLGPQRVVSASLTLISLTLLVWLARGLVRRKAIRRLERIAAPLPSLEPELARRRPVVMRLGKTFYLRLGR
ncbi:Hypothetical Protein CFBP6762_02191 [Xanthomonas arboricola pv. fragariae]|nr:hypothetical protein XarCFBP6762_05655 [Xanthomonas arboricola]SOT99544.1 Hypothetical Protein CFBP6762_02191 [Xanthomonas arboricola pv. fragariae]